MQISSVNNNIVSIKAQNTSSPFKSGTQIKATVVQINNDGTVVMESEEGIFTASNTSTYGLNVGDSVSLLVTSSTNDGSAATTAITQINGQPIDQNVSLSELHLIDLGVLPNSTNLHMYNILNKFQLPLTKEFIVNLKDIFNNLPNITEEQAAFMAVSGVKPTLENLDALTSIGTLHEDIASLIKEAMANIVTEYGISDETVTRIINALNNSFIENIPEQSTDNPSVQAQPEGTPVVNTESAQGTIQQAAEQNPQISATIPAPVINSESFIGDKPQTTALLENFLSSSLAVETSENDVVANLAPKVIESLAHTFIDNLAKDGNITLKTISDLKLPEKLPQELQQVISALPENVQQELDSFMPKVLQSAKEFLSVKLINYAENQLQVKVSEETTGSFLEKNVKSMSENIKSILTDKPGDALARTVTSLKLSDNTMSFVQIPITFNDFRSTAEMYVVKRDGHKKLSLEDGIKLVFALNTQHLGRIESIISANTRDLNLNIRVENAAVKEALYREIGYLKELLRTTDFNISVLKVTEIDKKITVLNAHTYFGYKQLDITV